MRSRRLRRVCWASSLIRSMPIRSRPAASVSVGRASAGIAMSITKGGVPSSLRPAAARAVRQRRSTTGPGAPVENRTADTAGGRALKASRLIVSTVGGVAGSRAVSAVRAASSSAFRGVRLTRIRGMPRSRRRSVQVSVIAATPTRATGPATSAARPVSRSAAISDREVRPAPTPVSRWTRLPARSADSTTRRSSASTVPAVVASSRASRSCPRISRSPGWAESRPDATR